MSNILQTNSWWSIPYLMEESKRMSCIQERRCCHSV